MAWRFFYLMVSYARRCGAQCSALYSEGKPQYELRLPVRLNPATVYYRSRWLDGARAVAYRYPPRFY